VTFPRALVLLLATASVALGLTMTLVSDPAGATATASDVGDAYVTPSTPSGNFGSAPQVTTDARPSTFGYFRFTVSVPAGQVVSRAVFRCWAGSSNGSGAELRPVSNAWDERMVTWANAPHVNLSNPPVAVTGPVTGQAWARADVTRAISGSGTYAFAMTTASPMAWSCASRENAAQRRPALDITTMKDGAAAGTPTSSTAPPSPSSSPAPTAPTASTSSVASSSSRSASPSRTSSAAPASTSATTSRPPSTHASLRLPARGTFYYPWFAEAWKQSGYSPATHYQPSAGYYNSLAVVSSHVRSMVYGGFSFAASSWWGQGSKEDARFGPLLTAAHGTSLMVAPYYEAEGNPITGVAGSPNPTPAQLTSDLNYLAAHYVDDPSYLWIAGKPAIFVYGDGSDSCATAARWATANAAASRHFYVVLKVVGGYQNCANQPDNWHQYGPASAADSQGTHSYTISPGFYKFSESSARLARDPARWVSAVKAMNCSSADFKLVTTFNEWGEGSSVEAARQWASASGEGTYLDALHAHLTC
jgi:hypothetical protein